MSAAPPRFSVVIPTYERRDVVRHAVAAFERQELRDFEVIVVVDGSTDGTGPALRELRPDHPLRVVEQPNSGAAAARNHGAGVARGELLLFLDDDMEPDPGLLAAHDRAHRAGADVVLGHIPLHPDSPRTILARGVHEWAESRRARLTVSEGELPLEDMLTGQISLSRTVFDRVGGFDTSFTRDGLFGGEDIDFGHRVVAAGFTAVFAEDAVSYQRFIVDPSEYLRRSRDAGRAAAELVAKHPEREADLGRRMRLPPGLRRYPMGALVLAPPFVSAPLRAAVSALVRSGRSGRLLGELFHALRRVEAVRGVRRARRALDRERVLALAYHAVADLSGDAVLAEYGVPPGELARQLDVLAEAGHHFIGLDRLLEALDRRAPLPRRPVLLTFDDAYADLRDGALPVLAERGIPAVVFAVAGLVGESNEWDRRLGARELPLLDAAGLRALYTAGIEVGAHSVTHRELTGLPDRELGREASDAAQRLEETGLPRPRAFSYPYGEHDARTAGAVRAAGYELAFTVTPGVIGRGADRYALPRVEVLASDRGRRFQLRVRAAHWPELPRRVAYRLLRGTRAYPG